MATFTVGTINLHCERAGVAGSPRLLLLHEGGSTAKRDFGTLLPLLAQRFDVAAPDLRGHGASDRVDRVHWPGLTRDVEGVLAALGWPDAHVLGVGDGATVALHVAVECPERVRSLVLVAPRAHVADDDVVRLDALRPENLALGAPRLAAELRAAHGGDVAVSRLLERWVTSFRLDRAYLDVRARLPEVSCPTLVVHGASDPILPPSRGEEVARAIPRARFVLLDAGRAAHATPEFVRLALRFYEGLAVAAAP